MQCKRGYQERIYNTLIFLNFEKWKYGLEGYYPTNKSLQQLKEQIKILLLQMELSM